MQDDTVPDDAVLVPGEHTIPQRLNLLIIACQLLAFAGVMILTAHATQWWHVLGLSIGMAVLGNSIYSVIHEAEHGMLLESRWWNDWVGAGMALLFPAPYHLIRQGHLGHHRRNRSDDEAFDLYFEGDWVWLKWLILYGIITGFYWMLVVLSNVAVLIVPYLFKARYVEFDRPSAAFMEALNPRYFWLIQIEAIAAIALHLGIMWLLDISWLNYFCVYFGFGFSWSAMQYVHHFGTERDVLAGSRNLRFLSWIDWIWLHHNYHLTHHCRPLVPWLYLPQITPASSPRESLVRHYFKMWRGPRKATRKKGSGAF